jgi:hypothetical protein
MDITVVIVSFNTRALLLECLENLSNELNGLSAEIILVDNASVDGSVGAVRDKFPNVRLVESAINLGFAAANNVGFRMARGRYIVMLNTDAFLSPNSLHLAFKKMEADRTIGLGGARLVGRDGAWQPSARLFPSPLNDLLHLSGLASKYPRSRFFGRADRTWASPEQSCETDWVPGAFSIIRHDVLKRVNYFDERFFLYYEEVDLCRKIKKLGFKICYWADVIVIHVGGESSKTIKDQNFASKGSQLTLWRMRSQLLYYRKHYGYMGTWLSKALENGWHRLRAWKNSRSQDAPSKAKAEESRTYVRLMSQAWQETKGGSVSPPKPW